MSNRSDRFLEILVGVVLNYSRLFGVCNYSYDFKNNCLTYPRKLVIYTIIVDAILILFLPISLWNQLHATELSNSDKIKKLISMSIAVAICAGLIGQWTNHVKIRILFKQIKVLSISECSNLRRNPRAIRKNTALFLTKMFLSICFVFGAFLHSSLTRSQNPSIMETVEAVYFVVMENLIMIMENQFYMGLLYTSYLFEALNDRIVEVVQEILTVSTKKSKRKRMGILMQTCCILSDDLDVIGKIHTDVRDLTLTVKDLHQFQILTILLKVFVTQVLLCFYAIAYLGSNKIQLPVEDFYLSGMGLGLSAGNLSLLIYVCGAVVYQCDLGREHLKLLTFVQPLDSRLEKSIEMLSFQLLREKMQLQLCGMINIDWRTGFTMISACVANLIRLIQMDYKQL